MNGPKRSWLFAPGMDERKMTKALASTADALILDVEDAVAISEKPRARKMVRHVVASQPLERQISAIRSVRSVRPPWYSPIRTNSMPL